MNSPETNALTLPEPDAPAAAHSEMLAARIRDEIEAAGGSIPFQQFMQLALYAPALGYYASGSRKFFDGRAGEVIEIPLYRREDMAPGATIAGPAVIAEDETSTFVSTSFDAHIDGAGSIVMERKAA